MVHTEEGTEGNLHSGHMVYTTALVENALTEISEWLENHPQEGVILACRNSEGMMEDLPAQEPDGLHQEHLWRHAVSPWGAQGPQAPHALGSGSTRLHCNQTIRLLHEADSDTRRCRICASCGPGASRSSCCTRTRHP
ncbi:unnamed protein product [Rangifer tarandus platyrhynchus]|uniref:Uncharacterized protein n=1 Tax=Rangifer tarandus platyrhynchus TaxID=3082113 RepID=A0ABN8XTU5_RANTA|nr:unnamed protein product [Rangifer tarandus platyrhynchus]